MTMAWRKSSRSGGVDDEACVEVAELAEGGIGIRDSKDPAAGHLRVTTGEFAVLVRRIKHGAHDLP